MAHKTATQVKIRLGTLMGCDFLDCLYSRKRNDVAEFFNHSLTQLAARAADFGKLIFPLKWPHRVENRPAVGVILRLSLVGRHARIEWRAPAAVDDIDIGRRIDPGH